MRYQARIGAVVLTAALGLSGAATVWADEPAAQRERAAQVNGAVIHVEGMT
ncbi:MAG: hypothetical protein M9894_20870 [Planctomycetes bacterium]|nr:hypothetical protein [Planctomycetota bacterium]